MVYTYWYIPISYLYYKLLNFENQQSKIDVYKKDNLLKITDIKLEGKKRCLVSDFVNGIKINDYLGKVLK